MNSETYTSRQRFVAYILNFLYTLHFTLPVYATSTYLALLSNVKWVGVIYAVAYFITVIIITSLPKYLTRFGNYKVFISMLAIELVSLIGLAFAHSIWWALPFFIASAIVVAVGNDNLDIFVENFSADASSGLIRGFFNTSGNLAWAIAPLITGLVIDTTDYPAMFITAACILVPTIFISSKYMKDFKDPQYKKVNYETSNMDIRTNPDLLNVFIAEFLLQFFYSWMAIYIPFYLHQYIGFTWAEIGIIFAIMLLPFLFIEIPLGKLADTRWGEKEALSIGFIILALSTGALSFIDSHSMFIWAAILFTTRIGAAMVESMCETYFFKKIDSSKAHLIGAWHTTRPIALVISPLLATSFLLFFDIKYIFIFLGFLMFYGVRQSLALNDTQ